MIRQIGQPQIVVQRRKKSPLTIVGGRVGQSIAQFQAWFLATGTWNNDGVWFDSAWLWEDTSAPWFLDTSHCNVFGSWDDSKTLWDAGPIPFFLAGARLNVYGNWQDSEELWT